MTSKKYRTPPRENHMQELITKIRAFARERDWDQFHSPKNLAMALSVEVAEVVEHLQWLTQAESNRLDAEKLDKIRAEIGDVMIYIARLADRLGIDPLQAAHEKMLVNEEKYPVAKAKGLATKYTDL
jgi:NTP pyrophosphatase (non-canonical NTP hydrolase)